MSLSRTSSTVCFVSAAAVAALGAATLYSFTTSRDRGKGQCSGLIDALRVLTASAEPPAAVSGAASQTQAVSEAVVTAATPNSTASNHAADTVNAVLEQTHQGLSVSAGTHADAAAATGAPDVLCGNLTQQSASQSKQEDHIAHNGQHVAHHALPGQPDQQESGLPYCPQDPVHQAAAHDQDDQHWQEVAPLAEQCQEQQQLEASQKHQMQLAASPLQQPGQLAPVPPLQFLQQHMVAAGPPSERDKAIMYRLSIDKSIWDTSSCNTNDRSAGGEDIGNAVGLRPGLNGVDEDATLAGRSGGAASVIAAFERSLSRQASTSNPTSPRGSIASPRGNRQRQVFNTARNQPSLDTTVATAAVARSLAVQYSATRDSQELLTTKDVCCLSSSCALLCKQHCSKLQEAVSELGETTALDIGCGTGGSCFELALSFSHVLGLDSDAMHVVAAKELKEKGQLEYRPVHRHSSEAVEAASTGRSRSDAELQERLQSNTCVARVSEDCDRDKVRFWCYPLPELPPKLQPVDAVVVEDVEGRLNTGLFRVCQQLPALLNPGGVCVVVLPGSCSNGVGAQEANATGAANGGSVSTITASCSCSDAAHSGAACRLPAATARVGIHFVRQWLEELGLQFVEEQELLYSVAGASDLQGAVAGVWLQPK